MGVGGRGGQWSVCGLCQAVCIWVGACIMRVGGYGAVRHTRDAWMTV
jgi:hypothetical protein